jgi:hypothetical protein
MTTTRFRSQVLDDAGPGPAAVSRAVVELRRRGLIDELGQISPDVREIACDLLEMGMHVANVTSVCPRPERGLKP